MVEAGADSDVRLIWARSDNEYLHKKALVWSVSVFHLVAALPGVFAMSSSHRTRWSLSGSHEISTEATPFKIIPFRFLVYQLITVSVLVFFIKQVDTQSIFIFGIFIKRRFLDYIQLPFFSRNTFWGESYDIPRFYSENKLLLWNLCNIPDTQCE